MKEIKVNTKHTDRKISYIKFNTRENWKDLLPKKDWSLVMIANDLQKNYFDLIIRKSLENNVGYIHAIGEQHGLIHDMADEEIIFRDVDVEDHYLPKHMIPTTGDSSFEDGLWFGINLTLNNETKNKEIIIVDFTENSFDKTNVLIKRFEDGYVPKVKECNNQINKKRKILIAAIAFILLLIGYLSYSNHCKERIELVTKECLGIQKNDSLDETVKKVKNNTGISYDLIISNSDYAGIEKQLGYKLRVAEYYYTGMRIYSDSTSENIVAVLCPGKEINIFE